MSTEENSNDAKIGAGYLKEKFLIGLSRITNDEVERAIMKTTSHMLKAPNEKHMARLIQATFGNYNSGSADHGDVNRYIVEELEKRSHTHNWVVVLKTFVALHRLMTDGSPEINRIMQQRMSLYSIRNIKDLADSPEGAAQKAFIEQYIRYLEERNVVQYKSQDLGLKWRIESDECLSFVTSMDLEGLAPVFELLLAQLDALNVVEFRPTIVDNFCTMEAYRKVVCDGKRLYQILANRMLFVLERFEDFPLPAKQKWLRIYQRYDKAVKGLAKFFVQLNSSSLHWGELIPTLKLLPESLMKKLEDEVKFSMVEKEEISTLALVDTAPSAAVVATTTTGNEAAQGGRTSPQAAAVSPVQSQPPRQVSPSNQGVSDLPPTAVRPSVVATAPKADVFDDLFSSTPVVVQPSAKTTSVTAPADDLFGNPVKPTAPSAVATGAPSTTARNSNDVGDLFGGIATTVPVSSARTVTPRETQAFAVAEPPVSSVARPSSGKPPAVAAEFDPFAPVAPPAAPPIAQSTLNPSNAGGVDFFSNAATPQQQYASRTSHSTSAQPTPFSELAAQGKNRAW